MRGGGRLMLGRVCDVVLCCCSIVSFGGAIVGGCGGQMGVLRAVAGFGGVLDSTIDVIAGDGLAR